MVLKKTKKTGRIYSNCGQHLVVFHVDYHFVIHGEFGRLSHCRTYGFAD